MPEVHRLGRGPVAICMPMFSMLLACCPGAVALNSALDVSQTRICPGRSATALSKAPSSPSLRCPTGILDWVRRSAWYASMASGASLGSRHRVSVCGPEHSCPNARGSRNHCLGRWIGVSTPREALRLSQWERPLLPTGGLLTMESAACLKITTVTPRSRHLKILPASPWSLKGNNSL